MVGNLRAQAHALHAPERNWPETNCYVDVWVELLHDLGLDPVPWEWDRFVTQHASITRLLSIELADGHTFALTRLSDVEHLPRDARTQ